MMDIFSEWIESFIFPEWIESLIFSLLKGDAPERLVTGSDDFTMYLWQPEVSTSPIKRMTGHFQVINQVRNFVDVLFLKSTLAIF